MNSAIHYKIEFSKPETHLFDVTLVIQDPLENQQVTLPAWIPGSYMIRDYARNIISIRALAEGKVIPLRQLDKQTWQLVNLKGPVRFHYQVYAWDMSVRGAHLDNSHAYFNGSCMFLKPLGRELLSCSAEISSPENSKCADWEIATSLSPIETDKRGFGLYMADNYEDLIDHPVEIGIQERCQFSVQGVPHQMVFSGRNSGDIQRICNDMSQICGQHVGMMGELPVASYLFLTQLTGKGYGGLEHRRSTSLIASRNDLPLAGDHEVSEGYRRFLGLCSHEYFHLWNVKRIRPEVLQHADLSEEVYTELLWAFEGITSYYDDLALLRSGCISLESYLELLAQTITRVMRGSGRHKQSVANSSFNAWTRFYKQDENAPNAIVSYYTKGSLVALGLDLLIRRSTEGADSLDTLMRELWQHYGKPDIGVPEDGITMLVNEICGQDKHDFFKSYVHGVAELPLEDWLAGLGIGYRLRPGTGSEDNGGYVKAPQAYKTPLSLGARYKQQGDLVVLEYTSDSGAAQAAGLAAGDRMIALDGLQVTALQLNKGFPDRQEGDTVEILAFRDDELMTFQVVLEAAARDTCELWLINEDALSDTQREYRDSWSAGY